MPPDKSKAVKAPPPPPAASSAGKGKKKRNSKDSLGSSTEKKKVSKGKKKGGGSGGGGGGKSKSNKFQGDIFNEGAMENAYYICHNVQDVLKNRGFPWPDGAKKKKKGRKK